MSEQGQRTLLENYAVRHWVKHAKICRPEHAVQEHVFKFLNKPSHGLRMWRLHYPYFKFEGISPLFITSSIGLEHSVEYLLNQNSGVIEEGGPLGGPLIAAVFYGHENVARKLLERGADPNHQVSHGMRPLVYAIANRDEEIAKLLLEWDAEPDFQYREVSDRLASYYRYIDRMTNVRLLRRRRM